MAASVRPPSMVNTLPGPVVAPISPISVPPISPVPPMRPATTSPSQTPAAQLSLPSSPTRPTSGIGFGAIAGAMLRPSSSLSRPTRPTISITRGSSAGARAHDASSMERAASGTGSIDRERQSSQSQSQSQPSSTSGSKTGSFVSTPRLVSRNGSGRDQSARLGANSKDGRDERPHSVISEADLRSTAASDLEVTETPQLRLQRDPETGKKMINQYIVMQEIGHGTHGRVRLGRDTTVDMSPDELESELATGSGSGKLYAIKIVERNPKKKRLAGLTQRGGRTDGNRVAENEIRKEIAIFKKVHHPNVVRMKEIIDDPDSSKIFMILEYCSGGEVEWKGPNGGPALSLAQTRLIFRDTLLGLEYLHHQGIIHRDIKPSNLLRSGDKVKIADFGCSHYSEALYAASQGSEGECYVDDIELAKTAGSPAFFAPEMCYSEVDEIPERSPRPPGADGVPSLVLRPPSAVSPNGAIDLNLTSHIDTAKPVLDRTESANTLPRTRPRHPITNAIDVWAIGVTFYCLLFGKTPFDAANEYLLMQVIPTAQYQIPPTMSSDQLPTGANAPEEVKQALDLLSRLLEKDASKRITLDQAKRHPFTLCGMAEAEAWLAKTDPHAQTRVTVTNDEVTAAFTRGGLRERFKRHFKSISNRFGFLGGRTRSHSVTTDSDVTEPPASSAVSSRKGSSNMLEAPQQTSGSGSGSGSQSPITGTNLARRLSMLTSKDSRARGGSHGALGAESPRPGLLASALDRNSPPISSPTEDPPRPSGSISSDSTPRQLPSMVSLEKIRAEAGSSPVGRPRNSSLDVDGPRPRSGSNASSSGSIFSALGRNIFSRENSKRGSQRSNGHPIRNRPSFGSAEDTDQVFASSVDSHPPVFATSVTDNAESEFLNRRSMDDVRRQSMDTFDSGSPGSMNGLHHHFAPSPDRERLHTFESRFRAASDFALPPRRGSTLSEDIRPVMEDEEVDWEGDVPDSDDCVSDSDDDMDDGLPQGHGITSAPADWNLAAVLDNIERKQRRSPAKTVRGHSLLRPADGMDFSRLGSKQASASYASFSSQHSAPPQLGVVHAHALANTGGGSSGSLSSGAGAGAAGALSSVTASGTASVPVPFRMPPSAFRARSPLGDSPAYSYSKPTSASITPGTVTPEAERERDINHNRDHNRDQFQDADEDDGLVLGLRRGRKGSSLSRQSSVMSKSPPVQLQQ